MTEGSNVYFFFYWKLVRLRNNEQVMQDKKKKVMQPFIWTTAIEALFGYIILHSIY